MKPPSAMNQEEAARLLCEIGRRVWQRGYVASNDGNFSVRLGPDRILATPTGVSKGFMEPADMVVVDLDGKQSEGKRASTSEIRLHLFIYRHRPDVGAVVHAHPAHATAFAVAGRALPRCVLPEIEVFLGEIPTTAYKTPGTWDFAETLAPYIEKHHAWLLESHGVVTCGPDPLRAYYRMESVEHFCSILVNAAALGGWKKLAGGDVDELHAIRERYDLPNVRDGKVGTTWCDTDEAGETPAASKDTELRDRLRAIARQVVEEARDE